MSEQSVPSQVSDLVNIDKVSCSPGELLRTARETAGIHVAALAGALKVSVSKLEALENDNFSALPDAVFARALASSICRILNLDPAPVLKLMPKNEDPSFFVASSDINTAFKDNFQKIGGGAWWGHATRPISVTVVLLLLGILALLFLPFGGESPVISAVGEKANMLEPASMPEVISVLTAPSSGAADKIAALESSIDTTSTSHTTSPDLISAAPNVLELAALAKPLEFRALGESWVQVQDATKAVVFERTLAKGDIASATGVFPLTVVIGRADATEVYIHGKIFAVSGVAKDNVARFEVKQ